MFSLNFQVRGFGWLGHGKLQTTIQKPDPSDSDLPSHGYSDRCNQFKSSGRSTNVWLSQPAQRGKLLPPWHKKHKLLPSSATKLENASPVSTPMIYPPLKALTRCYGETHLLGNGGLTLKPIFIVSKQVYQNYSSIASEVLP
jgi:hypothetical protein